MSGGLNREFHDDPVAFFLKYNVYGGNLVGGGVPPNPFPGAAVLGAANVWDVGAYTEDFDFGRDQSPAGRHVRRLGRGRRQQPPTE
jgi:hypothetical protein